jgi:HSP20 family molecular chaperone IbpA
MVTQKITATADDGDTFLEINKLDQTGRSGFVLDAYEVDKNIELTAEVPGVRGEDLELNLEGNLLTISVNKRAPDDGKHTHFSERSYGQFQRAIRLPFAPEANSVTAYHGNGVLTVRFPRVETTSVRKIPITRLRPQPDQERRDQERPAVGSSWADEPLTLTKSANPAPADSTPPPREIPAK